MVEVLSKRNTKDRVSMSGQKLDQRKRKKKQFLMKILWKSLSSSFSFNFPNSVVILSFF